MSNQSEKPKNDMTEEEKIVALWYLGGCVFCTVFCGLTTLAITIVITN